MKIAIIPARGGSKRIPRKNIRKFHGLPILYYPIQAALDSGMFEDVYVSTEDKEIARLAMQYGAKVIQRPAELADDRTGTQAVMRHALRHLANGGELDPAATACCIYPTAALLHPDDLIAAHRLLIERGTFYAFSVVRYDFPIEWALRLDRKGLVKAPPAAARVQRSQDLEHAWHDAGYFYWGRVESFVSEVPLYGPWSAGFEIPRHRWQDINTESDWKVAERLYAGEYNRVSA